MKWCRKIFYWLFGGGAMVLDVYRDDNGRLKPDEISEGYVLYDYNNKPIAIFVCANGVWLTIIPYDEGLDKELGLLLGEKFVSRNLEYLVEIQERFAADLAERKNILRKSIGYKK